MIHEVAEEIDQAYLHSIEGLQLHPAENLSHGKDLHIIYSSLHGGGITMIPRALTEWGFTNVTIIKEQATPDGRFPTVKSPNPEYPETLKMGIERLQREKGDVFFCYRSRC